MTSRLPTRDFQQAAYGARGVESIGTGSAGWDLRTGVSVENVDETGFTWHIGKCCSKRRYG